MRLRPAAHLADEAYIAKYNKATELMRGLPEDDPVASCNKPMSTTPIAMQGTINPVSQTSRSKSTSWLFFPWHRYYIYFFEKIFPFWNWDSPKGMTIPSMYTNTNSALYDMLRDKYHMPPAEVDFNYMDTDSNISPNQQIKMNMKIMYRQMVLNGKTPQLFLGMPYRWGDEPNPGAGSFEMIPHNTVHFMDW
ncbi:hypothetical protein RD792_002439 [Penstemon davidsonii]|uniref:Tyrosinase copper-binding domain-containing protein n=1 Tax=Penstemon davidsonii TaxID=160366 RepID=A0ABR0DR10_9LAMI|nr:hypothetical protein RD792_002439 [Penstemon davidsonii]